MDKKKKKKFSFQGYFKKSPSSISNEDTDNQNDHVDGDHTIERNESEVEFSSSHVRTQFCKNPLGLVAYYRCTEGKHTTLEDSSGCHRPASIRNHREEGADSPWMFKLKNKELVDLENKRGEKAKANYCLKLSGKSKCYLKVESDNCLELLGGNYCTNERAIKIKKEISKKLCNENNEGFTFEIVHLVIENEECYFLIDFKNEKFRFDSFPLAHLKTKKINDYYWTHVSIIFNLTIDLIYVILTGESNYFLRTCKNKYAIFYSSVFYPTNFFIDTPLTLPLYLGAKPYTEFGDSDGSDDMEEEENIFTRETKSEKRRSSKSNKSHKGNSEFISFLVTEIRLFALSRSADLVVKESKAVLDCAWLDGTSDKSTTGRAEQQEEALNGFKQHSGRGGRSSLRDEEDANSTKKHAGKGKSDNQWGKLSSDDGGGEYAALSSGVRGKGAAGEGDDIKNRWNEFNNEIEKMREKFHRFSDEMKGGSDGRSAHGKDVSNANGASTPSLRPRSGHTSQEDFFKFESEEEQNDCAKDDFFFNLDKKNTQKGNAPTSEDIFAKKKKSDMNKENKDKSHSNKSAQLNTTGGKDYSAFYFNFSDDSAEKREEEEKEKEAQLNANKLDAPEESDEEDQTGQVNKPSLEGEETPSGKKKHTHSVDKKNAQNGGKSPTKKYLNSNVMGKNGNEPGEASDYKEEADVNILLNELKDKFEKEFMTIMVDKLGHKLDLNKKDKEKLFSNFKLNASKEKEEVDSGCIREKYVALQKVKEDRQKNKVHEEIKEELKKVKEQSIVEKNLNCYIKDNQLLNEYYIKKYAYGGEQIGDNENGESFPHDTWAYEKKMMGRGATGAMSNSNSVREESHTSDRSHSIVNLQYQDGSHVFAEGGEEEQEQEDGSRSSSSDELTEQMGANRNAYWHTGEGDHHPKERIEQEEKKSDISDFTFMKSSSGRGGDGGAMLGSNDPTRPPLLTPPEELRMVPSNDTDLLLEEGENEKKSISSLLLSEEQSNEGENKINQAIKTGKYFYQFICPLTPYELFLLTRFHKKGINEELKEFRNKKYLSCEKQVMPTAAICRTPLNVAYIKYKIKIMKSMLKSSRRYIHEKKFKKGLKVCIKNGEYIKNFVSSYCVLKRKGVNGNSSSTPPSMNTSQADENPYQYSDLYLNVDNAYITMDELKNILKANVRNIIICKLFILMKEYKKYKYIENSSLILALQSVLCRIVTSYTLLRKILIKFILYLFLRGCLSCVESMCNFLFLMYPKERNHPLVAKVYALCKNSFLMYSTCYKSNKYAMINNYDLNFEQCVESFSPEWGYYIYTTSNFNIFCSSVKFNGFLKRGTDFSAVEENQQHEHGPQQQEVKAICGLDVGEPLDGALSHVDAAPSGEPTNLPEEELPIEPTNEGHLVTVDVGTDVESKNKKGSMKNDLYTYLTNYEKKKRSYYIIDDNMKRIEFTRKETNHNLETFLQMENPNGNSTEQTKKEQLDRLMRQVNRDVCLNSSGSCTNANFLGHCPHCKHAFNFFTRSCKVCQRYVHVCYYLLIHCTYKYHCELCDATYSEKCLEKFSKGFTCFYCGLFFIRK
ncbi:hypothetical protein AK88_01455 [Plasmodium fragile]|uniref:Uncharacterized protein n=1 Tax=Plasmodium fragile TaxID=5857 RepID=A0A0D9QTH3_PLAFR|nr:uncharacterized protein AK88_01455 [Plasmodium fragile]KJP88961.1 hypothetical protein AK88_01455 [Plasmodium fragile]